MTLPILSLAVLSGYLASKGRQGPSLIGWAFGLACGFALDRGDVFGNLAVLLAIGYALSLVVAAGLMPYWLTVAVAGVYGVLSIGNPSMLGCFLAVLLACAPLPRLSHALCFVGLGAWAVYAGPTQPLALAFLAVLMLYPVQTFFVTVVGVAWNSVFPLVSAIKGPPEGWLSSNGRLDMWAKALREWPGMDQWQGAFFGSGPGTARMILPGLSPDPLKPFVYLHSDWLELLLTWGLVGLLAGGFTYVMTLERALDQGEDRDLLPLVLFGAAMVANYPWHEPAFALLGAALVYKVWRKS